MKKVEERRLELDAQVKTADKPLPLLHPSMADLYRSKVEELAAALQREDSRLEASEMLRGLIDANLVTSGQAVGVRGLRGLSPTPSDQPVS